VGDDPRRNRGYDYDRDGDRQPPRRPPPLRDYDGEDRGGKSQGAHRRGEGGLRPPRAPGERGGRHDRYDGMDGFGDRSNNRYRQLRDDGRDNYDERGRGSPPRNYQPTDADPNDGKSKKWFSFKKDKAKTKSRDGSGKYEQRTDPDVKRADVPRPPPPPPPPLDPEPSAPSVEIDPAGTERTPIHYMFPTAEAAAEQRKASDDRLDDEAGTERDDPTGADVMDTPFLDVYDDEFANGDSLIGGRRRRRGDEDDRFRASRVSPRRDAVTMFMSSRQGRLQVRLGSMIVGAALGGFFGKSLMNDPLTMAMAMSSFLLVTGFLRNDYGELSRALGLAFVLTLKRTRSVRKHYPTLPHLKAMIRQGPRKPFPPVEDGNSPWTYEPIYRDDPEFKMTYVLLSMALVGSFCGGNIPILPVWIGGIAGALAFASLATGSNARGDLGRSMGMRVVGLVQLILAINSELRILGKTAKVSGLIFDKIMIMDRKHRIKDKIAAICKWGYEKVVPDQIKEEVQVERPERRLVAEGKRH